MSLPSLHFGEKMKISGEILVRFSVIRYKFQFDVSWNGMNILKESGGSLNALCTDNLDFCRNV
jgi:hypothetical protein